MYLLTKPSRGLVTALHKTPFCGRRQKGVLCRSPLRRYSVLWADTYTSLDKYFAYVLIQDYNPSSFLPGPNGPGGQPRGGHRVDSNPRKPLRRDELVSENGLGPGPATREGLHVAPRARRAPPSDEAASRQQQAGRFARERRSAVDPRRPDHFDLARRPLRDDDVGQDVDDRADAGRCATEDDALLWQAHQEWPTLRQGDEGWPLRPASLALAPNVREEAPSRCISSRWGYSFL